MTTMRRCDRLKRGDVIDLSQGLWVADDPDEPTRWVGVIEVGAEWGPLPWHVVVADDDPSEGVLCIGLAQVPTELATDLLWASPEWFVHLIVPIINGVKINGVKIKR